MPTLSLDEYKAQAQRLQDYLGAVGVTLKHKNALEAVAVMYGYENFESLRRQVTPSEKPAVPVSGVNSERRRALPARNQALPPLRTGFGPLDHMLELRGPQLVILAGRPSTGKSTLARDIIRYAAVVEHAPVGLFLLESPREWFDTRVLASVAAIAPEHLMLRERSEVYRHWCQCPPVVEARQGLQQYVWSDEGPAMTFPELRTRALKMVQEGDVRLIVVDYMQLIDIDDNRTKVPGQLKALAVELQRPILVLSALNRKLEQRANKCPVLTDVSESVRECADAILLLYREELYSPSTGAKDVSELIVGKAPNPPSGEVLLPYDRILSRFKDMMMVPDSDWPMEEPQ